MYYLHSLFIPVIEAVKFTVGVTESSKGNKQQLRKHGYIWLDEEILTLIFWLALGQEQVSWPSTRTKGTWTPYSHPEKN